MFSPALITLARTMITADDHLLAMRDLHSLSVGQDRIDAGGWCVAAENDARCAWLAFRAACDAAGIASNVRGTVVAAARA